MKNKDHFEVDEGIFNNKLAIYQIFIRLFGNKMTSNILNGDINENGAGKFNDINLLALNELKKMGITHIWFTGIMEHATTTDYTDFGIRLDNPEVVKGKAGSPYAIKDYYDVNPDLADNVMDRMNEFEALIKRTHDQGLKALIDFVPNHVARQYYSDAKPKGIKDLGEDDDQTMGFSANNNFYYLPGESFVVPDGFDLFGKGGSVVFKQTYEEYPAKASGNNVFKAQPSVVDWYDTVKLNYGIDPKTGRKYFDPIPDTWEKMKDILLFWIGKGIDGFRCDMVEMVPVEFWNWIIPHAKTMNPDLLFIAEIYNPSEYENYLMMGKFDFLYDKVQLYDTLKNIIRGKETTDRISMDCKDLTGINRYMLRFLENHDEQRIASPAFAGNPFKALPAMVVSATLYTGPIMIYFGQEVGEPGAGASGFSGDDGRSTIFDYWGVPEHQKWMNNGKFDGGQLSDDQKRLRAFYMELINLAQQHEAINKGRFFDLHSLNRMQNQDYMSNLYTYLRYTDLQTILVATNFSDRTINAVIAIPLTTIKPLLLKKLSGGAEHISFEIHNETSLVKMELKPWDYAIVEIIT